MLQKLKILRMQIFIEMCNTLLELDINIFPFHLIWINFQNNSMYILLNVEYKIALL